MPLQPPTLADVLAARTRIRDHLPRSPLRAYPGYYALSKVLEETLCNQYRLQYGLPVTILRASWIWEGCVRGRAQE